MIDLHCHSTASDGTYTPSQLVDMAVSCGVTHLALTDHDTTAGLEEFLSGPFDGLLIPGIELSVEYPFGELHMVGLFIDKDHSEMTSLVKDVQNFRIRRNEKLLDKLSRLIKKRVSVLDLMSDPSGQLGRPHIAKYLVKNGFAATMQEAFSKYLSDGGLISVPKERVGFDRAVKVIKNSGGVAILAHPSTLNLDDADLDRLVAGYKNRGLDGMEVFSSHTPDDKMESYLNIARKHGLAVSGGSDFHGGNSKVSCLGASLKGVESGEILDSIMKIADTRK